MAVGDAERAFAAAAEADGLILERASVPWINQRGHFGLPAHAVRARASLNEIFTALGGDRAEQESKKLTPLRGDFIEVSTGTFIEIDELQHFTSFRAASLQLYPPAAPLGFGRDDYLDLCTELAPRADRYRAARPAKSFGPGGRQRQRAYYDAVRDLGAPECGRPPVIRVPVLDGDGAAAYTRERDRIRQLIERGPR